jgi:8-amino-7-oxononanoate synthase
VKQSSSPLAFLADELAELEHADLLRRPPEPLAPDALTFCSNDYLGLAQELASGPSGAGASRLIAGERAAHRHLERAFAAWLGVEEVLAFSSGYAANVGVLSSLVRPGDLLVSDALNHASIIDGARLARAEVAIVPHNDVDAVDRALGGARGRRAWVVVESYYSMDADGPDLRRLRATCDRHGAALIVDEAHALGVLGPGGRGRCAEAGVRPDVLVGTLGKAFGSQGAFVAGSSVLRAWLWNRARSFVFSTGLAPVCAVAGTRALARVVEDPSLPTRVLDRAARLREGLDREGVLHVTSLEGAPTRPVVLGFGHIVPIVVGPSARALGLAADLQRRGFAVHAVRPPTVPRDTARLRVTVTARHAEADVDALARAFGETLRAWTTDVGEEARR